MNLQWLLAIGLLVTPVPIAIGRTITVKDDYKGNPGCLEDTPGSDPAAEDCMKTHDVVSMAADTKYAMVYPECNKPKASPSCGRQFEAPTGTMSRIWARCTIHEPIPENKLLVLYGLDHFEYISFDNTTTTPLSFEHAFASTRVIVSTERLRKQRKKVFFSCVMEMGDSTVLDPTPADDNYCTCSKSYPVTPIDPTSLTKTTRNGSIALTSPTGRSTRIQGGTVAPVALHPWAAGLKSSSSQMMPEAMGVLIAREYVLTSSDAIASLETTGLPFVSLGMHNVRYTAEYLTVQATEKKLITDNSLFATLLKSALPTGVLLKIPTVTFSRTIIAACPLEAFPADAVEGTIFGWGINRPSDERARPRRTLHELTMPFVSLDVCKSELWGSLQPFQELTDLYVQCAKITEEMAGFCNEDLGGPLMVLDSSGKPQVAGFTANSPACRNKTNPGEKAQAFVKIPGSHFSWITLETAGGRGCSIKKRPRT